MNLSSGLSSLAKAGGVGLVLTAAVLAAAPSASLWYVANVVIHPLLGLCLGWTALRWVWRAGWPPGSLPGIAAGVAGGSLLSGVVVLGVAVAGRSDAVLAVHVWVSVVGAALVGLWGWRVLADRSGPGDHTSTQLSRAGLLLLAAVVVAVPSARAAWDTRWRQAHAFENPTRPPATMAEEGAGAGTALFPSSAQTSTGDLIPSDFFLTSETCAEALEERGVDAETIEALRDLLVRCDFARFAPTAAAPADMAEARRLAGELVERLEGLV